ncbi:MAG: hypothetical protein H6697_05275 [Myxococcales bacterium]|nr:hypothetical protein [Myxococcales bacterium]MCB9519353.1 hypothetical protein [Myxococcales bacterium]
MPSCPLRPYPPRVTILVALAAALTACAPRPESPTEPPRAVPTGIAYALSVDRPGGPLHVRLSVSDVPLPPRMRVALPSSWAGRDDLLDDLRTIRVTDLRGDPLDASRLRDGVVVATGTATGVIVDYDVAPRASAVTGASRFVGVLTPDWIAIPATAALLQPLDLGAGPAQRVLVSTPTRVPGWVVRATIPLDEPLALADLVDAELFAGRFAAERRSAPGGVTVELWAARPLDAAAGTLADTALAVAVAQASIIGPARTPTSVVVLPRSDGAGLASGSGRAGGFVLQLGEARASDPTGLVALIAHEHLHQLIGHGLRFDPRDEVATAWFREGLTDYVAVRGAARAGLLPVSAVFARAGDALDGLRARRRAELSEVAAGESFGDRLPYDFGFLVALCLDAELRARGSSLDAVLVDLRLSAGPDLTRASIREVFGRYLGVLPDGWDDPLARSVESFEAALGALGLELVTRVRPAPYYGIAWSVVERRGWRVDAVDAGSPAAAAGAYPGMALVAPPWVDPPTSGGWGRMGLHAATDTGSRPIVIAAVEGVAEETVLVDQAGRTGEARRALGLVP